MKNVIVLQHIKIEDPGYIKDLMIDDGINLTTIELDEGESIPSNLTKFDAMFCMGGPMDTWMEKGKTDDKSNQKRNLKEKDDNVLKKQILELCETLDGDDKKNCMEEYKKIN